MDKPQTVIYVTQNIGTVAEGASVRGAEIGQITTGGAGAGVGVVERRIPRVPAPRRPAESILIGRDQTLQAAIERVRQGGKFYFHGAYGVGKTSLSSELFNRVVAAGEPPDGYLWGSLAGMGVDDALEWIAGALQEPAISETSNLQAKVNALRQAISMRKQLLIGLDDVRDGSVAQAILDATGDCPLILNGSRSLDLGGRAVTQELEPLSLEEARALFLNEAYPPGQPRPAAEQQQIDRIIERLGNLPLAVRLAARQRRQGVSPARLLDMLAYSPDAVFSAEEGLLAYLRSLQQELQDMPAARNLLARLAAFPAHHASIDALQSGISKRAYYPAESFLVERCMIERQAGDRLQLHGLLAVWVENAEPQTYESERQVVEAWLGEFAQRCAEAADYGALETEQANLLGLLERYRDEQRRGDMLGLLRALFDYLRVRGLWGMSLQALEAALQDPQALGDPNLAGWSYLKRGYMHTLRGERQEADRDLEQADQIFSQTGDLIQRGETWYRRAALTQMSGDLDGSAAQLEQALTWMGDSAPRRERAGAHQRLAILYATQGKLQAAEAHFQRAVELGDPEVQAAAYIKLGSLRREAGDPTGAQAHFEKALPLIEGLGHLLQRAQLLQELGYLALQGGEIDQAKTYFEQADDLYAQLNYPAGLAFIQHSLGNLAFVSGDLPAARQRYEAALKINLDQGLDANAAYNRFMLGVVAQRQDQIAQALALYQQALAAARSMKDIGLEASCLYQLGDLHFHAGELALARENAQQSEQLAESVEDRQTQAAALALLGRVQAAEGQTEQARQSLSQAYTQLAVFNPPDAEKVMRLLGALDPGFAGMPAPLDLDRIEGGGYILQGNVDVLGSAGYSAEGRNLPSLADAGEDAVPRPGIVPVAKPAPEARPQGNFWDSQPGIDRIEDGGVFRDFDAEEAEEE